MPLLKPSKTVSRRIKRSTPLSFHPPAPAPAPASFPLPKSICSSASAAATPPKERVLRVICTDPDATDSSSDEEEEEEEEEEDRQGGVVDDAAQAQEEEEEEGMILPHLPNNRKRRLVHEVCLPAASASASASPNTIDMASRYDSADDDGNRHSHAKKLSRREQHQQEALDCGAFHSCASSIHSTGDQDDEFCRLFPSELFALPDGAGDSVDGESWGVGWVLPEDDSLFNDADLHLDYPITTAWFDSLHSLPS